MVRFLSCFCDKADPDIGADTSPRLHRLKHHQKAGNGDRIASPVKQVSVEKQHDILGTQKDTSHAQNVESEQRNDIAPVQELLLRSESTTHSQAHTQSALQINSQEHLGPQLRKRSLCNGRNLWEEAEQRLDEDQKVWLKPEQPQPMEEVIENIQKEAKRNYKEQVGEEKKKGKSGAQEKFKNILHFTLQAQDCIGAVLKFDPTGYASTAWTIVSFGLTLLESDIERRDSVVAASEYLAGVISYYTIIDISYRLEDTEAQEGLEDALVEAYAAILKYVAEVEKTKKESLGARFTHSVTALVETPLKDLKASIDGMRNIVGDWKSLAQDEDKNEVEVLEWLSAIKWAKSQNEKERKRSPHTGAWILESKVYEDWKATAGIILWLHGVAGCGKSYLCSKIIHDIEKYCKNNFCVLAYWYFDFSDEKTRSVENMVRCLLRQIVPSPFPACMQELRHQFKQNKEPDHTQLLVVLNSIISVLPGDIFIVFDALDECPQEPARKERDYLLQFMNDLIAEHPQKLHIVATSRPESHIQENLRKCTSFDIEASLGDDARKFIQAELRDGELSKWKNAKPPMLERIEDCLLKIPESRFRWADLQIKRLEGCHAQGAIEKALASVPQSLEESYQRILLEIDKQDKEAAHKILSWLSFSLSPLRLDLVQTVAILAFPESVTAICTSSLVTLSTDNTIRLAHFSVKEFLISDHALNKVRFFYLSAELEHRLICERLVLELHENSKFRMNEFNSEDKPLLEYAARFWDGHLTRFSQSTLTEDFEEKVDHIFLHRQCYCNWMRYREDLFYDIRPWLRTFEALPSPIATASKLGFIHTVKALLKAGEVPYKNTFESDSKPCPYVCAAREGNLSLLAVLLEAKSKPRDVRALLKEIDDSKEGERALEIVILKLQGMGVLEQLDLDGTGQIFDYVAENATANKKCGPTLIRLLLFNDECKLRFTMDSIFLGAAETPHSEETFSMALQWLDRGTWSLYRLDVLAAAVTNTELARLWFTLIIGSGFCERQYLQSLIQNLNLELMKAFIEIYGQKVIVTDEILIAAARNRRDSRIFAFFLKDKSQGEPIGDEIFHEAFRNLEQGLPIFQTLLDACGSDRLIGEEIFLNAIGRNHNNGHRLMEELSYRGQAVSISEELLLCAAWHKDFKSVKLLVGMGGPDISITEMVLSRALDFCPYFIDNGEDFEPLIEYILDSLGAEWVITEDLLIQAAQQPAMTSSLISTILDRTPTSAIPNTVFTDSLAYRNSLVFESLLTRTRNEPPIQEIVRKISKDSCGGGKVIEILIQRGLVSVDKELVEVLAGNSSALEFILKHSPTVEITQKAFEKAGEFGGRQALLKFQNLNFSISEEMVKSLISEEKIKFFPSVHNEGLLIVAFARLKSKVSITEDILLRAANSPSYYGNTMRILLDQKRPLNLQRIWECMWQSCCRYSEEVSDILLEYTPVEISRGMFEGIPSSKSWTESQEHPDSEGISGFQRINPFQIWFSELDNEDDLLARLIWFLVERNFPIPQDVMDIVVQKSHFKTILTVLAHNPHLQITDEIRNAAMMNPDFYDVMWILHILPLKSGFENVSHVISWPHASNSCNLPGCWVVHSSEKRDERRDLTWYKSYDSSTLPGYWTV